MQGRTVLTLRREHPVEPCALIVALEAAIIHTYWNIEFVAVPDGSVTQANVLTHRSEGAAGTCFGYFHAGTVIRKPRSVVLQFRRFRIRSFAARSNWQSKSAVAPSPSGRAGGSATVIGIYKGISDINYTVPVCCLPSNADSILSRRRIR